MWTKQYLKFYSVKPWRQYMCYLRADCYSNFVQIWDRCRERWTLVRSMMGWFYTGNVSQIICVSQRGCIALPRSQRACSHATLLYYMIFSHWSCHFCIFIFHGQKKVILHWGVDWIKLEGWWYHFYCSHSTTNLYSFFFTEAALNHCRWTDHQKPLEGKHPEHRGGHVNLVVNKHQQQQVLLACEFWPPCISAVQKNKLSQALETLYLLTRDKVQNLGLPRRKKCSLSPAPHLLNRALSTAASN